LINIGVFQRLSDGRYANNAMSAVLIPGHPSSAIAAIRWHDMMGWAEWDDLEKVVRHGEEAVEPLEVLWSRWNKNETLRKMFADFMQETSTLGNQVVVEDYDFCKYSRVIDMGGGTGGQIKYVMAQCPNSQGTIFELPDVARDGEAKWKKELPGLVSRVKFVGGSFLDNAPEIKNGEAFMFRGVLHDWSDEKVSIVLKHCREKMGKVSDSQSTRLVIVELFPDQAAGTGLLSYIIDINMMLIGGQERTVVEWDVLLKDAGFKIVKVTQTRSPLTVLEAIPN